MIEKIITIIVIATFIAGIVFLFVKVKKTTPKYLPLSYALDLLYLGMSEHEMLEIIDRTSYGGMHNKSLLKNNRVKYEWRISNGTSSGYSYKGFSMREYFGVEKLVVYCKDGVVEEIKPYNL